MIITIKKMKDLYRHETNNIYFHLNSTGLFKCQYCFKGLSRNYRNLIFKLYSVDGQSFLEFQFK